MSVSDKDRNIPLQEWGDSASPEAEPHFSTSLLKERVPGLIKNSQKTTGERVPLLQTHVQVVLDMLIM